MPRKKRTVTVVEEPEDEQQDDAQLSELDAFFEEIGGAGDIRYKLYRLERTGKHVWLAEGTPENFSEPRIQEDYGAGDYLVRAIAGRKWLRSKTISIGAPVNGAKGNGAGNTELEIMRLRLELDGKANERAMQQSNSFQAALLTMITALIGSNKGPDLAGQVALFRELNAGGNDISKLRDMVGLAKELNPGGGGDGDAMTGLITSIVPKLIPQRVAENPPAPSAPPAAPVVVQPADKRSPEEIMYAERMKLLQLLKDKAKAGKDPGFWAEYIVENDDTDASCKWILDLVEQFPWETLHSGLLKVDGDLANEPYKTWFEKLYLALKEGENSDDNGKNNTSG